MKILSAIAQWIVARIAHRREHRPRWVEVWETPSGFLMRGTRCSCGKLHDIRHMPPPGQQRMQYMWS